MTIFNSVKGWVRHGFCPMEAQIRDWGCPGCRRLVVVVLYAGRGDQTMFINEYETMAAAERGRKAVNMTIARFWKRLTAEHAAALTAAA